CILGQRFRPNDILCARDYLLFEESAGGRVRRSLAILFGDARDTLLDYCCERLPREAGWWTELVLQWHTGALSEPGLRRITDNYSLSLDFRGGQQGQTAGRIHLHLPTIHSTWLTGEIPPLTLPQWMTERSRSDTLVLQPRVEAAARSAQAVRPVPAWRE